jgi:TRAP-type C4-dicarboxylate transport system substrate-binding protein
MNRPAIARMVAAAACAAFLSSGAARPEVRIVMGTVAPTDSPWHKVLRQMGEDWKKASNGEVTLKILADGSLGDELAMVQKMRAGVLQGVAISGAGLPEIEPGVMALQLPMMFDSYEELDSVRDRIAPRLERAIEAKGFVVLNWGDAGWVHFFSKGPARTLDDLRKTKLFINAGDSQAENLYKSAGFRPVPLSSTDILPMLQTGVIDAFDVPPLFALSGQFFGLAKNMSDIRWAPLIGATVVSRKAWERVPAALQPKLLECARVAGGKFRNEIRTLSDQAIVEMEKRGLTIVKTTPAERLLWQQEAEAVWPKLRGGYVPADLFDEVKKLRDEYRAAARTAAPGSPK